MGGMVQHPQAISHLSSETSFCTPAGVMPSAAPSLHLSLGAQRCHRQPPATATHTVPRVLAKAGQTPTGWDVGLKSWNATRRHRGSPLCRELRPRDQLALINITQENTPGGHLTFIEHLLCEGPTWGSRKKKSMQPSSCPGAHSLVGQTSRHSNSSEGAFSVTVLQRAYICVFSTGNIQQHSHVVEKHIGINVNTATRLKGRTEITCSNSQLRFRARFSALFILF